MKPTLVPRGEGTRTRRISTGRAKAADDSIGRNGQVKPEARGREVARSGSPPPMPAGGTERERRRALRRTRFRAAATPPIRRATPRASGSPVESQPGRVADQPDGRVEKRIPVRPRSRGLPTRSWRWHAPALPGTARKEACWRAAPGRRPASRALWTHEIYFEAGSGVDAGTAVHELRAEPPDL